MITKSQIEELVNEKLEGTEFYIIDIQVQPGNKIEVELDGQEGFPISECVNFSRHIERSLDREVEDFSLRVSSPGLTKPFKVFKQYEKNMGRNVKVTTLDGEVQKGKMVVANEEQVELEQTSRERVEGKKKKIDVVKRITISMADIKETRLVLDF